MNMNMNMNDVLGIINLFNEPDGLGELTRTRCVGSVPFGGKYRLVDFSLSNMANSGISKVTVFASHKSRSLMPHLASGRDWGLDRKRGGLTVIPSALDETYGLLRGDLHNYFNHRDYLYHARQKYVLIAPGRIVANVDFAALRQRHIESGADVTVLYKPIESGREADFAHFRKLRVNDEDGGSQVVGDRGNGAALGADMEMMFLSKSLLLDLIEDRGAWGGGRFLADIIWRHADRLAIAAQSFHGFAAKIDSPELYFKMSMELLQSRVRNELLRGGPGAIATKQFDDAPAVYRISSHVSNSLIANGCTIEGTVENSILFRGVTVHCGAVVRNSIVLPFTGVDTGAELDRVILDKQVFITTGTKLSGDADGPFVLGKRRVM